MSQTSSDKRWRQVADRIVSGLGLTAGSHLYVHAAPPDCAAPLAALTRAVRAVGATLYVETELTDPAALREREVHIASADASLALATGIKPLPAPQASPGGKGIADRVTEIEESRKLPFILCAVPVPAKALELNRRFEAFEQMLLDAICVERSALNAAIEPVLKRARAGNTLTIRTPDCELVMSTSGRRWLADDGTIDNEDRRAGAIVSNLPAASIYTTVVEESVSGSVRLPRMLGATNVRLDFDTGRINGITAERGAREIEDFLDRHSGESRRIGHIGLGLNRALKDPIGWTLIDEHVMGAVFICFGENRYMGGSNESSLNFDVSLRGAHVLVDGNPIL